MHSCIAGTVTLNDSQHAGDRSSVSSSMPQSIWALAFQLCESRHLGTDMQDSLRSTASKSAKTSNLHVWVAFPARSCFARTACALALVSHHHPTLARSRTGHKMRMVRQCTGPNSAQPKNSTFRIRSSLRICHFRVNLSSIHDKPILCLQSRW